MPGGNSLPKTQNNLQDEFETMFEVSIDMICIANTGGRFEKISASFESSLGWSLEELMSNSILEHVHKDDLIDTYKVMGNLFLGNEIVKFENRFMCKSGEYKWLSWSIKPLPTGRLFATIRDVTQEKNIDNMKTEFISMASHQLRTPLSSVRWYTEMLHSLINDKIDAKEKKYLRNIETANLRMITLVSTLLNISRTESGRLIISPEMIDLTELLTSLQEELVFKAASKQQEIKVHYLTQTKEFRLDANILRNILMNLVTNALKYSPEKKDVIIKVEQVASKDLKISVIDRGYGIPKDDQEKVFTKFFRSDNISEIVTEGTGLGLYLVKQLVEISGGIIEFETEQNKGTKFEITFPNSEMLKKEGEVTFGA